MKALQNIIFLDIETVRQAATYEALDDRLKTHWARKASFMKRAEELSPEDLFLERAGIYAEFGRVVTIGLGYFQGLEDGVVFKTKALYGHDELQLLQQLKEMLVKSGPDVRLCAHNGREFDFPYLSRRMLINGISLPDALNLSGKKPWEVNHLDTMDMWKFGDWKSYTSLDLLASVFNIHSSKANMDGSMVSEVYYEEEDLPKIADYCLRDVEVTARLYVKLNSISVEKFDVEIVDPN